MHYFHGLAAALRLLREKRGLDDEALAQLTGMQRQQVNSYEHGAGMRVDTLDKLLVGLQAGLTELEDALVMVRFLGLSEVTTRKRGDRKKASEEGTSEDEDSGPDDETPAAEATASPQVLLSEDDIQQLIRSAAKELRRLHETSAEARIGLPPAPVAPPTADGMRVALRGLGFNHVPTAHEQACFELLRTCAQELRKYMP